MALIETGIYSEILDMETDIYVILPQAKEPGRKYDKLKVLWLLHGGSGDHTAWIRMTAIERYANEYGIAVVIPGALYSCFTDMAHGEKYATYITEELPKIVYSFFPQMSQKREDNFIAGLSNGGYGAFKLGLGKSENYGAIGALSAGNKADSDFGAVGSKKYADKITVFGEGEVRGSENDIVVLVERAKGNLPIIYHACGSLDPWLDKNHILRDYFKKIPNCDYTYNETEGFGHEWAFWDKEILRFLDYMGLEKTDKYF